MTVYYVSQSSGNDANAGTSTGAPWQTLNKVTTEFKNGTFVAGDQILFQRGDTWTITSFATSLRPSDCSGAINNHIVCGAYGSGPPPSFYLNGYQYGIIHNAAWSGTNPCEYLTIQDIEVRGPGQNGAWTFGVFLYDLDHVKIQRCTLRDINSTGGNAAITFRGGLKHFEIIDCRIYGNDGEAIYIGDSGVTDSDVEHGYVAGNYIYNNLSGIDIKAGCGHIIVIDNYIEDSDNTSEASIEAGGHHHWILRNRIKGTSSGVAGIRLGAYYQSPYGSAYGGRYCVAAYNTISGVTYAGQGGIALTGDDNKAFNNTIYNCYRGFTIRSEAWTAGATQVAKNNLMSSISSYPVYHSSGVAGDFDFDYNLYGDGTTGVWFWSGASRDQTYVQTTLGQEANGVFTTWTPAIHFDETEELFLVAGTIAQNAGLAGATAWNYNGAAPDIGSREYGHSLIHRIFEERFESDFSAFDTSSGSGMSIVAAARQAGVNGFRINITDITDRYQEKQSLGGLSDFFARCMVNADGLTGADTDEFRSLSFMDSAGTTVGYIVLRYSSAAGAWQVRLYMREDSGSYQNTGLFSLQAGWNYIEVRWTVGDAATAVYPGKGTLWLNDVENPVAEITGLTNSTRTVDRVRIGASSTIDAGTSGNLDYDELVIDYARIGPSEPVGDDDANMRLALLFENSGNLGEDSSPENNDFAENNNPGSTTNNPWRGSRSLDLEASASQYLSLSDALQTNLEPAGPFTLVLAARRESISSTMMLVSKWLAANDRSYAAFIDWQNDLVFNLSIDAVWHELRTRTLLTSTTRWLPLVFVWDGNSAWIFYRGLSLEAPAQRAGTPDGSTANIEVGHWHLGSPGDYFDGALDEIRFFDRAFTRWEALYWSLYGLDALAPAPPPAPDTGVYGAPPVDELAAPAAEYDIWLSTPDGVRIKLIDVESDLLRLEYLRVINHYGVMEMRLRADFSLSYFQEDSQIEVYRKLPGGMALDTDTRWLVRDWGEVLTEAGEEYVVILALSAAEILDRPIVAYAAGTPQASKSAKIDDMMKAVVRENLGSLAADTARDISAWLSVEADLGQGPSTARSFAHKRVLRVLKNLSQESVRLGTPIYFDVDGRFVFRTYANQRGADRGRSSNQRIILSPDNGTLTDIRRFYRSADERNFVYVGGQGQGAGRVVVNASDPDRIALSPFNRRELWVDARNVSLTSSLEAEAKTFLEEYRPRQQFGGKIVDTPAIRYGRDYNFGDRLVIQYRDFVADAYLNEVRVLLEGGRETIRAGLKIDV